MLLSRKVRTLRRKAGQSLQEVADGVGVSMVYIWELEKGKSQNPTLNVLKRLSAHFKVPINYFHEDQIEPEQAEALQFFREFDGKLSDKDWQVLRSMAKTLEAQAER